MTTTMTAADIDVHRRGPDGQLTIGWQKSLCPAWCNRKHLTEAIWFARNDFHVSTAVAVHLEEVPDTDVTMQLYEDQIEVFIESSGPGVSTQRPAAINVRHPGNTDIEDLTILNADQAEELALGLLALVRQLRDAGTCAPWASAT